MPIGLAHGGADDMTIYSIAKLAVSGTAATRHLRKRVAISPADLDQEHINPAGNYSYGNWTLPHAVSLRSFVGLFSLALSVTLSVALHVVHSLPEADHSPTCSTVVGTVGILSRARFWNRVSLPSKVGLSLPVWRKAYRSYSCRWQGNTYGKYH